MPRVLAALLAELVAVAILVGVAADRRPAHPHGAGRGRPAAAHRGRAARRGSSACRPSSAQLPEPARTVVLAVATESATNLQAAINGFVDSAASIVSSQILGVFDTLSFVLGLLVIPAWILTVVADEREIKRRAGSLLPVAMRPDAAAIVAIIDRAFGTFLRHRVLLAIASGLLVWVGLELTSAHRPDADPLHGDRRDPARLPPAHPGARLLPGLLPDPAVHPGERPGRGADRVRRVLVAVQGRRRPRRRARLAGRARRPPGAAAPGDRRAQPVRRRLAAGRGARCSRSSATSSATLRPALRSAEARRRHAGRPGRGRRRGAPAPTPSVYRACGATGPRPAAPRPPRFRPSRPSRVSGRRPGHRRSPIAPGDPPSDRQQSRRRPRRPRRRPSRAGRRGRAGPRQPVRPDHRGGRHPAGRGRGARAAATPYGRVPVVVRIQRQPPISVEFILIAIGLAASGLFLPLVAALRAVIIVGAVAFLIVGIVSRLFIRVPPGLGGPRRDGRAPRPCSIRASTASARSSR